MPDVYAAITEAEPAIVERLADVLELRASDPQQRSLRQAYLSRLTLAEGARVLEVGCGTGPIARALAENRRLQVVGLDPSATMLERARALSAGIANLDFREGDARALPFQAAEFDVVLYHTTLCHIPGPEAALAEAHRVLRPGGQLAIFDADYSTTSVATGPGDPLQGCAEAAVGAIVHDPHIVRRLAALVRRAGFEVRHFSSHAYDGVLDPTYLLTIVDRGAEALVKDGRIGAELGAALRAEARRRATAGEFFGHIAYASLIGLRQGNGAESNGKNQGTIE